LAEHGHRVTLADLSPALLEIAERKTDGAGVAHLIEEIAEADARDLSRWPDGSFDAALALGPFYHLPDPTDRDRAASELARVLRPGGVAFVALMPRYAFLRRTIALPDERRRLLQPGFLQALLERGKFHNDVPGRFTGGYGARPKEVEPYFTGHGFEKLDLLALEGILPDLQGELAEMAREDRTLHPEHPWSEQSPAVRRGQAGVRGAIIPLRLDMDSIRTVAAGATVGNSTLATIVKAATSWRTELRGIPWGYGTIPRWGDVGERLEEVQR
jgi:SAM-dependent methyltransferase